MGFVADLLGGGPSGGQAVGAQRLQQLQNDPNFAQTLADLTRVGGMQEALAGQLQGQTPGAIAAQQQLLGQLQQQAAGGGPNPAAAALQQATNQNVANQAAMMAGQGGLNPALAARMAAQQGANIQQQSAGQSAMMQAQQQLSAQQALGQLAGQQIDQAGQGIAQLRALRQGQGAFGQNQQALMNQAAGIQAGREQQQLGFGQGLINNTLQSAGGALAILSDERKKTAIADGGPAAQQFLDALSPQSYNYVQDGPQAPAGRNLGVMAQDLEQSAMGANLVQNTPQGKIVDYRKAAPAVMASLANINERLKQVEQEDPISKYVDSIRMFVGGEVPGQARVAGDSSKNDTVPALLSPGEIVIPRSQAKDPDKAAEFAYAVAMRANRKK